MAKDRRLDPQERILWGKVARSTRALPGRMEDLLADGEIDPPKPVEEPAVKPGPTLEADVEAPGWLNRPRKPVEHRHHPLEKPVKKKIARGRLPLEARIDLHGLFQSEAHFLLLDFLIRAHGRGLRHVLVITGKGSSMGSEGALKRVVPMWFSKPEFRHLISSHEPAAVQHGGDGALYVRLSRRPGDGM